MGETISGATTARNAMNRGDAGMRTPSPSAMTMRAPRRAHASPCVKLASKASFTHGLAWALLGALIVIALGDGVRIPASPLFIAFLAVVAPEIVSPITAEPHYVPLYVQVP